MGTAAVFNGVNEKAEEIGAVKLSVVVAVATEEGDAPNNVAVVVACVVVKLLDPNKVALIVDTSQAVKATGVCDLTILLSLALGTVTEVGVPDVTVVDVGAVVSVVIVAGTAGEPNENVAEEAVVAGVEEATEVPKANTGVEVANVVVVTGEADVVGDTPNANQ